jgi:L-fucose isomerase-like protein
MLVLGEYRCFEKLPDPARLRERLGVGLGTLSSADFLALAAQADATQVAEVVARWRADALAVDEPDAADIESAARLFVALHAHLGEHGYAAASVGCLEVMYRHATRPFCFVLATLRDMGLPAGCESDATATLTMLVLELLAERPAYMGNLVLADPARQLVAVSHGCSPRFMHGRDAAPLPYRLVHSHSVPPFSRGPDGGAGLTSYVDYGQVGQPVTLCRLAAELDECFVARGEIVECRDTICDRTTLTVRVADARAYAHRATGNHQVLVYGDFVAELRAFCSVTGMRCVEA